MNYVVVQDTKFNSIVARQETLNVLNFNYVISGFMKGTLHVIYMI